MINYMVHYMIIICSNSKTRNRRNSFWNLGGYYFFVGKCRCYSGLNSLNIATSLSKRAMISSSCG